MRAADALYPGYGFASHVGYITPSHTRESYVSEGPARSTAARGGRVRTSPKQSSRPRPRNDAELRAARWYRLRGYRVLDTNCWLARRRARHRRAARARDRVLRGEVEERRRLRRSARDGDAARRSRGSAARPRPGSGRIPSCAGCVRFDVVAVRAGKLRAPAARVLGGVTRRVERSLGGRDAGAALRRARSRPLLVGAAAPRARADEARPPPASVPRQVHPAARGGALPPARARRADACSIRSRARERRSCRRSRAGCTPSASTSPRSTACSCRSRRASTSPFVLEHELRDALARFERGEGDARDKSRLRARVVRAAGARGPAARSAR